MNIIPIKDSDLVELIELEMKALLDTLDEGLLMKPKFEPLPNELFEIKV